MVMVLVTMISCNKGIPNFQQQADEYAQDGSIERTELDALMDLIEPDNDQFMQMVNESGAVDTAEVISYLERYFNKRRAGAVEVWRPERTTATPRFNVNVFVENSASMDGYVKGVTDFETAMYNLMADIKLAKFCDSLNLNYINSEVVNNAVNALPPDIEDFIRKLEPTDFRRRGGNRGSTDIKEILRDVLGRVDGRNVAILISDFVFSPGKGMDATEYLEQQQVGIRIDIAQKKDSFDLAIAVIQLESGFNGVYYDRNNSSNAMNGNRPYYVWVIGSEEQLREVLSSVLVDRLKGKTGYKNMVIFKSSRESMVPTHGVQHAMWKEGTFNRDVSNGITGAEWDKDTRHFGFSMAVDLSDTWQEESYMADTENYRVRNPRYGVRGVSAISNDDPLYGKYTHVLELRTVETEPLRPDEAVRIELMASMPKWVRDHTSLDDSKIADDPLEMGKTFGLWYLMEGVYGAFYPDTNRPLTSINIPIKKK
jgi:hypothetical protein